MTCIWNNRVNSAGLTLPIAPVVHFYVAIFLSCALQVLTYEQ